MSDESVNGGLYSIGALSKTVGLSIDTLRFYDQIGIFKPIRVSRETGYRYYSISQAAALAKIMELKEYGFSLNEIKEILNRADVSLADVYQSRYSKLVGEKRKLQSVIDKLAEKIKFHREEFIMGKRILLVDDAEFMRKICTEMLVKEGYEIAGEAADGPEALEMYKNLQPDVVVLNITMPTWDGIYTLGKIKEADAKVNAVMLSGMGQARIIVESLIAGARDFVVKPFQPETLLKAVKNSFRPEKLFNQEILKRIHAFCSDDSYVLSQNEVDKIIQIARSDADNDDISSVISMLGEKDPDPVLARLDKLEHGMEELKGMLKELASKIARD